MNDFFNQGPDIKKYDPYAVVKAKPPECTHCGQECSDECIAEDNRNFCCSGCQTLYHLIEKHGLCNYYEIEELRKRPNLQAGKNKTNYENLDSEELLEKLKIITQGENSSIVFSCPDITCASCIWLLDNLNKFHKGIVKSHANFAERTVTVWYRKEVVKVSVMASIIESLGYTPIIDTDCSSQKSASRIKSNQLLARLGFAGFVAANTMMLSFPAYLGIDDATFSKFNYIFPLLNILLTAPLVVYSAGEYFRKSYVDLKNRVLSVDVPIAMAIGVLFIRSLVDVTLNLGSGFFDSLSGLVFLLLIGKWLQTRYYEGLEFKHKLSSIFPLTVSVIDSEGKEVSTFIKELKVGDIIRLKAGEISPADGIMQSNGFAVIDNSFITGESAEVSVKPQSRVYAGAKIISGYAELKLSTSPDQSYLTRLWNESAGNHKFKLQPTKFEQVFAKYFTIATLSIALIVLCFWLINQPSLAFNAFTAVLMVACPCALTLALPFASNTALGILAKNGFYARNAEVIARLAHINYIVFDKTGTLTEAAQITKVEPFINFSSSHTSKELIKRAILTAHSLNNHPILSSLTSRFDKIDSETLFKVESHQVFAGRGIIIKTEIGEVRVGDLEFCSAPIWLKPEGTLIAVSLNSEFLAYYKVPLVVKTGVSELINELKLPFKIITGDNVQGSNLLFSQLPKLSHRQVISSQTPSDKQYFIQKLQHRNTRVLMIGDGMNDSPAMKAASVSLAVTDSRSAFGPNADSIAQSSNLPQLCKWLRFSKATMSSVKSAFLLSLVFNAIGISLAASGILQPMFAAFFMPMSSLAVVALAVALTRWHANRIFTN